MYHLLLTSYHYVSSVINSEEFKLVCIFCFIYVTCKLCSYVYKIAFSPSGIQFVNLERQHLQMASNFNPFKFEAAYASAKYSEMKCTLKSDYDCYVQGFWGVPISDLFSLLYRDWQSMINALRSDIYAELFSSKCVTANSLFIIPAGEERCVKFSTDKEELHLHSKERHQEATSVRTSYPFVVMMVLMKNDNINGSTVVAMANAIHVADKNLKLHTQLIGQFIKLASGHIGQIKKIFLSSAAASDDDDRFGDLCVACYQGPVSIVFFPCRHACLCKMCFDLCNSCPICRITPWYYFELPIFIDERIISS